MTKIIRIAINQIICYNQYSLRFCNTQLKRDYLLSEQYVL